MGYGAQHRPPTHGTMYLVAAVVAQPCMDLRRLKRSVGGESFLGAFRPVR